MVDKITQDRVDRIREFREEVDSELHKRLTNVAGEYEKPIPPSITGIPGAKKLLEEAYSSRPRRIAEVTGDERRGYTLVIRTVIGM